MDFLLFLWSEKFLQWGVVRKFCNERFLERSQDKLYSQIKVFLNFMKPFCKIFIEFHDAWHNLSSSPPTANTRNKVWSFKNFFLLIYVLPESIIYLTWFHGFCEKRQKLLLSRQSGLAETTKEIFQPMEMCPLRGAL